MKLKLVKIKKEEDECDIYTDCGMKEHSESDQIDAYEEAFMRGYLD